MNTELRRLARRIRNELDDLGIVLGRVREGWARSRHTADDYYLDSVARNLHGLYSGLERLFELIAAVVEKSCAPATDCSQSQRRREAKRCNGMSID